LRRHHTGFACPARLLACLILGGGLLAACAWPQSTTAAGCDSPARYAGVHEFGDVDQPYWVIGPGPYANGDPARLYRGVASKECPGFGPPEASSPSTSRPNIVLITTDDMNRSDLRWMPHTRRLLGRGGVTVGDFISNHPLCCPARAQILTGQYGHNNGVSDNVGQWGGYERLKRPGQHVGRWLKDAGYRTAFVGKHLNGWEVTQRRQAGWTRFNPLAEGVYEAYGMTMYNDGEPRTYRGVHTADLMGRLTVRLVRRFSTTGDPFFIWTSQVPPHGMVKDGRLVRPIPAARHRGLFPQALPPALSSPAFNEPDVSDKPPWLRREPPVSVKAVTDAHRARIRSLQAVDEQVAATVQALRETGELPNTYVFFTSDNGYLMGEHRLQYKNKPYEPSLRLPLLVRGPGLPAGAVRPVTFGLVDLAPTFLDLAGAEAGMPVDGRSMLPALRSGRGSYSHYLIQAGGWTDQPGTRWWWRGVRSRSYTYVRYRSGFEELYDRRRDPAQLRNVADDPAYRAVTAAYARRLDALKTCAGQSCLSGGHVPTIRCLPARRTE
jgi:N-acetylglucosamine-6-sulfatase